MNIFACFCVFYARAPIINYGEILGSPILQNMNYSGMFITDLCFDDCSFIFRKPLFSTNTFYFGTFLTFKRTLFEFHSKKDKTITKLHVCVLDGNFSKGSGLF